MKKKDGAIFLFLFLGIQIELCVKGRVAVERYCLDLSHCFVITPLIFM